MTDNGDGTLTVLLLGTELGTLRFTAKTARPLAGTPARCASRCWSTRRDSGRPVR